MNFKKGDLIYVDECGNEVEVKYHSKIEDGWHVVYDGVVYWAVREERIITNSSPVKNLERLLKKFPAIRSNHKEIAEHIMDYFANHILPEKEKG